MKTQTQISEGQIQTRNLGKLVAKYCQSIAEDKPIVILLHGQLGAGKTTFVKGVGEVLGVSDVTSPTFIIIDEHDVTGHQIKKFFHIDLYRVNNDPEFENLKILEILKPRTITCIEWSENVKPILDMINKKAIVIKVFIEHIEEDRRKIKIEI